MDTINKVRCLFFLETMEERIYQNDKIRSVTAFLGGVIFIIVLFLIGKGITTFTNLTVSARPREIFLISILMGMSTGHYVGMAASNEVTKIIYFLLGTFSSLSFYLLIYFSSPSIIPLALIFTAIWIFVMHFSGIIKDHDKIGKFIQLISQHFSIGVLSLFGFVKYLWPFISKFIGV